MPSSGLAWVKLALLYLESEVEMVEMAKIVEMTETESKIHSKLPRNEMSILGPTFTNG